MTRARRTGAVLAVVIVTALAGCTNHHHSDATGAGGGGSASGAATHGVNDINPIAYDKLIPGGTLHLAVPEKIIDFNSYAFDSANGNARTILSAMLPSDFVRDAADNFAYNPDYLTGEPTVVTAPVMTIKYELNPKAVWSDGKPVSAADYIAQWQALNGSNTAYSATASAGYSKIASVAAGKDQDEVLVAFQPGVTYADWRELFAPLLPASLTSTPAAFNTAWRAKPLVSAGPFVWSSSDSGSYSLAQNPQWWGRKPALDRIVFRIVAPEAQVAALKGHTLDAAGLDADPGRYAQAKVLPGITVRTAGSPEFRTVTFNGSSPLLSDVTVRQALAMAIDRTAIATAELTPLGVAKPAALDNHLFMANQAGYRDNSGATGRYDPDAAKAKLSSAGWTLDPATNVLAKDGKQLALTFVVPNGVPLNLSEAKLVQGQLGKINVKVTIRPVPLNHLFDGYLMPGDYDLTDFTWTGTPFPIGAFQSLYASATAAGWQQNFSRISDPQVDTLFQKAAGDLATSAMLADGNAIDALLWQDVYSLTTYQRPDLVAATAALANYGAFGFATVDWTDVGFTTQP